MTVLWVGGGGGGGGGGVLRWFSGYLGDKFRGHTPEKHVLTPHGSSSNEGSQHGLD